MTDTASTPTGQRPKGRSPSYPALDLQAAVDRARQLYDRERQHPTNVETVRQHWGYKSLNGPASLALAALRKFGLVDSEGAGSSRRVNITDLAVNILANPDEAARAAALQDAALNPSIHREIWDKYGPASTISDANLHWELTRDRGFTETGASEFIPEYRATISFAGLTGSATLAPQGGTPNEHEDVDDELEDEELSPPAHTQRRRLRRRVMSDEANQYLIPLTGGAPILIEGEFPITEQDWTQMMAVLTAMKPGLVESAAVAEEPVPNRA